MIEQIMAILNNVDAELQNAQREISSFMHGNSDNIRRLSEVLQGSNNQQASDALSALNGLVVETANADAMIKQAADSINNYRLGL